MTRSAFPVRPDVGDPFSLAVDVAEAMQTHGYPRPGGADFAQLRRVIEAFLYNQRPLDDEDTDPLPNPLLREVADGECPMHHTFECVDDRGQHDGRNRWLCRKTDYSFSSPIKVRVVAGGERP